MNMIIDLLGCSLSTGNQGVSALSASLITILKTIYPESQFRMLIGERSSQPQSILINNKKLLLEVVNYRLSYRSKISQHLFFIFFLSLVYRIFLFKWFRKLILKNRWIRSIKEADLIGDIIGGDSFSDIYGLPLFLINIIPILIIIFIKKKYILFPQTYGPFKSCISRFLARHIILRAKIVVSRDKESFITLKDLLKNKYDRINLFFSPDVAFTLSSTLPANPLIKPPLSSGNQKRIIGININALMYNGGYTQNNMFHLRFDYKQLILKTITYLLENTDSELLLVPHTYNPSNTLHNDPDACSDVLEQIVKINKIVADRVHLIAAHYDQYQIKGIIGKCDFFIGSRMHSCIAALSQGIPTIGIAYSKKFIGVFNSVNLGEYVIDARSLDETTTMNRIKSLLGKSTDTTYLRNRIESTKQQIYNTFREFLNLY